MSERPSQTNLRPLTKSRLDGRVDGPTFGQRLKLFWAPIATILVIVSGTAAAVITTTKPLTQKANAKDVARDEAKQASDHDLLIELRVEVGDLERTTSWTQNVVGQMAAREGIHTEATPVPHPIPSRTP